jgi:hypothetical protein
MLVVLLMYNIYKNIQAYKTTETHTSIQVLRKNSSTDNTTNSKAHTTFLSHKLLEIYENGNEEHISHEVIFTGKKFHGRSLIDHCLSFSHVYSGIRLTRISRNQKNLFLLKAFCAK